MDHELLHRRARESGALIGTIIHRPTYYVTNKEAIHPVVSGILTALGAFTVDRGAGDMDTIEPAKAILRRGEARPLRFPGVEHASPAQARAVTDRIGARVTLRWESLGGLAPIRRAAI